MQKKFNAFKPALSSDWEVAAQEELKGADPWEKLKHNVQGCTILPFYTKTQGYPAPPLLRIPEKKILGARTWYNCPRVVVESAKESNGEALEHLRNGADGIFFELEAEKDFQTLLKDIDPRYCSLNFLVKKNTQPIAEALQLFFNKNKTTDSHLPGAFFGNSVFSNPYPEGFHSSGFLVVPNLSIAEEIAACFTPLTKIAGADFQHKARQVAFSIAIGTDFFLSVAKIRALRVVWNKLLVERNINENPTLFIHGYCLPLTHQNFQPHGNMLNSTTAAMAAILGGCDAFTLEPDDANQSMMVRVARNVSNILREESYLSKVADPLAGSYYVETITRQLADAAWKSIALHLRS